MLEKIAEIICEYVYIDPAEITEQANLRTDIGLSSLDLMSVASDMENTFGVKISERAILTAKTVKDRLRGLINKCDIKRKLQSMDKTVNCSFVICCLTQIFIATSYARHTTERRLPIARQSPTRWTLPDFSASGAGI